jgi:hypothetical protein
MMALIGIVFAMVFVMEYFSETLALNEIRP